MSEMVYVIDLKAMERLPGLMSKRFSREALDLTGFTLAVIDGNFMDRQGAEVSPQFKQIIPYVVFASDDDQYLTYQRTGSEARLAGGYSIGLGGHINPEDAVHTWKVEMIRENMRRELSEELETQGFTPKELVDRASLMGLLYDPSNEVGQVHLGVVYVVTVKPEDKPKFKIKSEGKNLTWMSPKELSDLGDSLENWSQILLDNL